MHLNEESARLVASALFGSYSKGQRTTAEMLLQGKKPSEIAKVLGVTIGRVHQIERDLSEWINLSRLGMRFQKSNARELFSRRKMPEVRTYSPKYDPEGDLGRLIVDLTALGIPLDEDTFAVRIEGKTIGAKQAGVCDGDTLIIQRRKPKLGDVVASLAKDKLKLTRYTKEHLKAAAVLSVDYDASLRIGGVVVGLIRRFGHEVLGNHR